MAYVATAPERLQADGVPGVPRSIPTVVSDSIVINDETEHPTTAPHDEDIKDKKHESASTNSRSQLQELQTEAVDAILIASSRPILTPVH
jgi:hypothetical protein